ncbi:MAG: hypothetical protein KAG97_06185 [Victivallales bacterium]|nr:hypothetical protein [Victivallales bacterium]
MTGKELVDLFEESVKRCCVVGDLENGVVVGLDLEGRTFTIFNGEVLNLVNADAIKNTTTREAYLNPGGDGLWPAPEGTKLGYEYSTAEWRVPPGLTGAHFRVVETGERRILVEAEVDLINASGAGVPSIFRRDISVRSIDEKLEVSTVESIEYIGRKTLSTDECLLAPWTLCQFDCGPGCEVVMPVVDASELWDMYEPSDTHRFVKDGLWHLITDGTLRFQVGMSSKTPWIEFRSPETGVKVRRMAAALADGLSYIDIVDADPSVPPSDKGVRYSVYCDTAKFMEIEASGGVPSVLEKGAVSSLEVFNVFSKMS